jgi:hypothetical protein
VLAGKDARAARPADRNGRKGILEEGSARGKRVHVRRGDDLVTGKTGIVPTHVIEKKEEDIGPGGRCHRNEPADYHRHGCEGQYNSV